MKTHFFIFAFALLVLASCTSDAPPPGVVPSNGAQPSFHLPETPKDGVVVADTVKSAPTSFLTIPKQQSLNTALQLYCDRLGLPQEYLSQKILDRYKYDKMGADQKAEFDAYYKQVVSFRLKKSKISLDPSQVPIDIGSVIILNHPDWDKAELYLSGASKDSFKLQAKYFLK